MVEERLDDRSYRLLKWFDCLGSHLQGSPFFLPLQQVPQYFLLNLENRLVDLLVNDPGGVMGTSNQVGEDVAIVENIARLQIVVFPKALLLRAASCPEVEKDPLDPRSLKPGVDSIWD